MVARLAGASLGLLAFAITLVAGLLVGNPVTVTLSRGILALFMFFLIGLALGTVAQMVIKDHVRRREAEIKERYREESASGQTSAGAPSGVKDDARTVATAGA